MNRKTFIQEAAMRLMVGTYANGSVIQAVSLATCLADELDKHGYGWVKVKSKKK